MNVKNIAVLCYEAGEWLGKVGAAGDPISACSDPVYRAFLEHMKAARDSFVPPLTRGRLQAGVGPRFVRYVLGEWKSGDNDGAISETYPSALDAARAYSGHKPAGFTKHDHDKPRADLLPPKALLAMARVLAYGAQKYDDENWRKGGQASAPRYVAACLRHVLAYMSGELEDEETGESHLAHAMTCLGFVIELLEEDDGIA